MRTRKLVCPAVWFVAGACAATLTGPIAAPAAPEPLPAARPAEAKAAKEAYEDYARLLRVQPDRVDVDTVYRWSLRWAQAEAASPAKGPAAAYSAHLDRMKTLAKDRERAIAAGGAARVEWSAAAYYVAEAERLAGAAGR